MSETITTTVSNNDQLSERFNREYNFAGVMADIALHIEVELQQATEHNRIAWDCAQVVEANVDGDTVIQFKGIKPENQPDEFTVTHTVEIVKITNGIDDYSYVERINLLINGSLFGQFTHVSRQQIFELAQTQLKLFAEQRVK